MRYKLFGFAAVLGGMVFISHFYQKSIAVEKLNPQDPTNQTNLAATSELNPSKSPGFQTSSSTIELTPIEPRPMALPALSADEPLVPTLTQGPANKNLVALTFDDGPHPVFTPKILDELRKRKIHATFFVLGERVKRYPWIVQQIIAEGHEIGNHTYDHRLLTSLSPEEATKEIDLANNEIKAITGYETSLFRPPYGELRADTKMYLREKNYKVILWSVDPMDWKIRNSDKILSYVVQHTQRGSIILCHDIHKTTLDALPQMLDVLLEEGYEFATVNQLCDLPAIKLASKN